jgi:inner membrane protein
MPSILAHPFVAAGLAPWLRRHGLGLPLAAVGGLCTIVPDADVLGYWWGVPYDSLLGHRGISHSLLFAALLAAALTSLRSRLAPRASAAVVFWFLFACTASHGLLDALTDGGLGVAFFAPFSNERYFLPWRPIAVSPLSVTGFFTPRGLAVAWTEARWVVLPSLALGLVGWWSSRRARARRRAPPI